MSLPMAAHCTNNMQATRSPTCIARAEFSAPSLSALFWHVARPAACGDPRLCSILSAYIVCILPARQVQYLMSGLFSRACKAIGSGAAAKDSPSQEVRTGPRTSCCFCIIRMRFFRNVYLLLVLIWPRTAPARR